MLHLIRAALATSGRPLGSAVQRGAPAAALLVVGLPVAGGPPAAATETPQSAFFTVFVFLAIGGLTAFLFFRQEVSRPVAQAEEEVEDPDDTETLTELAPPPPAAPPPATLHITGPAGARMAPLDAPEVVLGRDPTCAIAIADPQASRRHARIVLSEGVRWIEDLQSLNGTLVNGMPVMRQALNDGDEILLGDTRLTFRVAAPAAVTADAALAQD